MSAPKTHLKDSPEPLIEGKPQVAICGALVPNAAFVFMWDEETLGGTLIPALPLATCRKCARAPMKGRYCYGIRSGEESKQAEAN